MVQLAASPGRYGRATVALHWLTLALIVAAYAAILLRELWPRGSDPREALKALHFSLGLSVFILAWARLAVRALSPRQRGRRGGWIPRITHLLLYVFLIGMPLLGWLALSAEGDPVRLFGLPLPALTAPNAALGDRVEGLHETIGEIGYWLIGLHAAAALFHHYVLKDDVLRRMLPAPRP